MEGRAPSAELRGVRPVPGRGSLRIYRQARNLTVELTDEVRGVLDRLWRRRKRSTRPARRGREAPFRERERGRMSDAPGGAVRPRRFQAELEAEDEMANRVMAEMRRKNKGLREAPDGDRGGGGQRGRPAEGTDRLVRSPAGTLPNGDQLPPEMPPIKLSLKAIRDIYRGRPSGHAPGTPGLFTDRGSTPDEAAVLFGFRDGKELLDTLETMGSRADTIRQETDARLKAEAQRSPLMKAA